jgi:parallel beta-helix repeat protein
MRHYGSRRLGLCVTLLLVLSFSSFSFSIINEAHAYSQEVTQLLIFFHDVLAINTSQCTITANEFTLGTEGEKEGIVTLKFNGGSVDATFRFKGQFLTWCILYYDHGGTNPISYLELPTNDSLEMAHKFLVRYENFTKDASIQVMRDLLDMVGDVLPTIKIQGIVKMAISDDSPPEFSWSYTFEGSSDYRILTFRLGGSDILTFSDSRYLYNVNRDAFPSYYPVGLSNSSMQNVTAQKIALSNAQKFSSNPESQLLASSHNSIENKEKPSTGYWNFAGCACASIVVAISFCFLCVSSKSKTRPLGKQVVFPELKPLGKRSRRKALGFWLAALLICPIALCFVSFSEANFGPPPELPTITIEADGSVTPSTAAISRNGDIYTLSGDITDYKIMIHRNNTIVDGAGHSLLKTTYNHNWYREDGVTIVSRYNLIVPNITGQNNPDYPIGSLYNDTIKNVTIKNLSVSGFGFGIFVSGSTQVTITGNTFLNNRFGITLADQATQNTIGQNIVTSGGGLAIYYSPGNTFRNNNLVSTGVNLWIDSDSVISASQFVNDIDASNLIQNKPIYYMVNQQNKTVPTGAGYVALINCNGITVENQNLRVNSQGVLLVSTRNSTIRGNIVVSNNRGIALYQSQENTISANDMANNTYGICAYSSGNVYESNRLQTNTYDVNFEDGYIEEFDTSNIINGTPICYLKSQQDKTVPMNAGYVVLLSCSNITVKNLNITGRNQGILLVNTANSTIARSTVSGNGIGIYLKNSSGNLILQNHVLGNVAGIVLLASSTNNFTANKVTSNRDYGVKVEDSFQNVFIDNYLTHNSKVSGMSVISDTYSGFGLIRSNNNTLFGNTIMYGGWPGRLLVEASHGNLIVGNTIAWTYNHFGVEIRGNSRENIFHHNNFINNQAQPFQAVITSGSGSNSWDDNKEGNFWSDYHVKFPAAEVNASGIESTAVGVGEGNVDRFPLVKPVNHEYQATILQPANSTYATDKVPVSLITNAPASWIGYSVDGKANVSFSGDIILTSVPPGSHSLTMFAGEQGGIGASETVEFRTTLAEASPAPSLTPTSQGSPSPSSSQATNAPDSPSSSPLPTVPELNLVSLMAVVALLSLFALSSKLRPSRQSKNS